MIKGASSKLHAPFAIAVLLLSIVAYGCSSGATPTPTATAKATAPATKAPSTGAQPSVGLQPPGKPSGNPVKVGFMTPLTGRLADYGRLQEVAVKLAVEDINASGGINGKPFEVVPFDTAADPQQAVIGTRKFIEQDKVFAILGPFGSGEVETVAPIANQLQTPMVTASSSKPGIIPNNKPWAFRYAELDENGLQVALDAYKKTYTNVKKVLIIGDTKESVSEYIVRTIFPRLLKERGYEVLDTIPFETGITDFSAIVSKAKGINPDGIAFNSAWPGHIGFAKEMERQAVKTPVVTSYTLQPGPFLSSVGSAGEGWVGVRYSTIENPDPDFQKFLARFNERVQAANLKIDQVSLEPGFYDTMMIFADIMRKANIGAETNLQQGRTTIREGLTKLKNWKGPYGVVSMSADNEMHWQQYPHIAKGGKWMLIK
ncbi:MAG: ABC transporter substrate-binding protein [Chloroflexi bacterium]|nr:ABC transporter substrate-binding protein [Chloroflexota bacterium]